MATSNSINFKQNRDQVITLALRRVNAIAQGETPDSTAVSEASTALNALIKAWQADGMPLWKLSTDTFTTVAGTASYNIGVGSTIDKKPPLKLHQAWYRNTSTSKDTPLIIIERDFYNTLPDKSTQGTPSQIYYNPPGNLGGGEMIGTFYLYNAPNSSFASGNTVYFVGQQAYEDMDGATDDLDFPSYWVNAIAYGLAVDLAFEYGVKQAQLSKLERKADKEKTLALSFGSEEGSMTIVPNAQWIYQSR